MNSKIIFPLLIALMLASKAHAADPIYHHVELGLSATTDYTMIMPGMTGTKMPGINGYRLQARYSIDDHIFVGAGFANTSTSAFIPPGMTVTANITGYYVGAGYHDKLNEKVTWDVALMLAQISLSETATALMPLNVSATDLLVAASISYTIRAGFDVGLSVLSAGSTGSKTEFGLDATYQFSDKMSATFDLGAGSYKAGLRYHL